MNGLVAGGSGEREVTRGNVSVFEDVALPVDAALLEPLAEGEVAFVPLAFLAPDAYGPCLQAIAPPPVGNSRRLRSDALLTEGARALR